MGQTSYQLVQNSSINSRSFGVHIEGFRSMLHLRFLRKGNTSASPGFMMKFIQDAAPGACKHVKFHTTKTLDLHRWQQKMTLENPPFSIGHTSAMLVFGGVWSIHIYLDTSTPAFRKASKKRTSRANSGEVSIHSWNWHSQKQQFFAIVKAKTGCRVHSVKTKIEKC